MLVGIGLETFAKEVTDMTKDDDKDVTDVSGQKNVVRRILLLHALVGKCWVEPRRVPEVLVGTVPELGVHRRKDLLGRGGDLGVRQPVRVLFFLVKHGVF